VKLNRPVALLIGLITLAPWAYFVFLMVSVMPRLAAVPASGASAADFLVHFRIIWRLQVLMLLVFFGLMIVYIVHLFRSDRVPPDKKALWAVVLFLGNLFAMPFYWYSYMWPRRDKGAT
jgi:hypothetical protein